MDTYEDLEKTAAEHGARLAPRDAPTCCIARSRDELADTVAEREAWLAWDDLRTADFAGVPVDVVTAMRERGEGSLTDVRRVLAAFNLVPVELPFPKDAGAWRTRVTSGDAKRHGTLYLTGDTHGENIERFSYNRHEFLKGLTADDVAVVLGDAALMWPGLEAETLRFLQNMEAKPFQVVFLFGNHDNYDWAETLPEVDAFGGRLRQVVAGGRAWPGRYVCDNWAVLELAGRRCLLCAHAQSNDATILFDADDKNGIRQAKRRREWFRIRHQSWWPQEKLDAGALSAFAESLAGEHIDVVLTHDCPTFYYTKVTPWELVARWPTEQEKLFDRLRQELDFGVWAHGHMHRGRFAYRDEGGARLFCLYDEFSSIDELEAIASRAGRSLARAFTAPETNKPQVTALDKKGRRNMGDNNEATVAEDRAPSFAKQLDSIMETRLTVMPELSGPVSLLFPEGGPVTIKLETILAAMCEGLATHEQLCCYAELDVIKSLPNLLSRPALLADARAEDGGVIAVLTSRGGLLHPLIVLLTPVKEGGLELRSFLSAAIHELFGSDFYDYFGTAIKPEDVAFIDSAEEKKLAAILRRKPFEGLGNLPRDMFRLPQ